MDTSNLMTPRQFAESMGYKANYGHQLKRDGRLVMADDGKHCLVRESLLKFEATKDPSKQGVADRHAAARAPAVPDDGSTQALQRPVQDVPAQPDLTGLRDFTPYDFQDAKAKREHWAAEREHAAFRKEAGELMDRGQVVAAFADAGATLRGKLESWSATLPPQLAGRDESVIRAMLIDQVEQLLHDLVSKFNQMSGSEES